MLKVVVKIKTADLGKYGIEKELKGLYIVTEEPMSDELHGRSMEVDVIVPAAHGNWETAKLTVWRDKATGELKTTRQLAMAAESGSPVVRFEIVTEKGIWEAVTVLDERRTVVVMIDNESRIAMETRQNAQVVRLSRVW